MHETKYDIRDKKLPRTVLYLLTVLITVGLSVTI